jgi:hypothetical protein
VRDAHWPLKMGMLLSWLGGRRLNAQLLRCVQPRPGPAPPSQRSDSALEIELPPSLALPAADSSALGDVDRMKKRAQLDAICKECGVPGVVLNFSVTQHEGKAAIWVRWCAAVCLLPSGACRHGAFDLPRWRPDLRLRGRVSCRRNTSCLTGKRPAP